MEDKIFVCFEENYNECALDAGNISDLIVFQKPESVINWVRNRVASGQKEGFVCEYNDFNDELKHSITNNKPFCAEMFYGKPENYNRYYAIVVDIQKIAD